MNLWQMDVNKVTHHVLLREEGIKLTPVATTPATTQTSLCEIFIGGVADEEAVLDVVQKPEMIIC